MRWSKAYLFTTKEAPNDAEIPSHQLMARAGLIRKVAPGIYTYGHLALRSIRKFEAIVREELNRRGCQEILMPMVHPAALWQETNRWVEMGDGLLKFENRNGHAFCLGATHEECVTDYVRRDIKSYRDMPVNLYQIQTKYRDEIRPRFGLMRGREFIMKDAYSFDVSQAAALKSYDLMYEAYTAIFKRLGARFRVVQADAGNIGGSQTHEFQLLADAGEDHLMVCGACEFAANIEVAPARDHASSSFFKSASAATGAKPEEFATPGLKTIDDLAKFLKMPPEKLVKTLFFSANPGTDPKDKSLRPICVLVRGSDEVNPVKLKNALGLANPPLMLTDEEVLVVTGARPGSCGPVGLKIPVYADHGLGTVGDMIVGANRDGFHLKGVQMGRDFQVTGELDLRLTRDGDECPNCKSTLSSTRGIEVGHVFYLGTKYAQTMGASFVDADSKQKTIEMGCYGIGVSRTVQAVIEQSHDADGIIWPLAIAPFAVHLCVLDPDHPEVGPAAEVLYRELQASGYDVLLDDRNERPGVKFKDADLLGLPVRLNIGARGLAAGEVEVVIRRGKTMTKVPAGQVLERVLEILGELRGPN
jgi:prolyl-tRNA synthetase